VGPATKSLPNGTTATYSYLTNSWLSQVEHKTSASATFGRYSYTYDNAGNRLTQASFDGSSTVTQTFAYDGAHRLTSEQRSDGPTVAYTYDAAGNRLSRVEGSANTTYEYDSATNRLSTVRLNGSVDKTFTYDPCQSSAVVHHEFSAKLHRTSAWRGVAGAEGISHRLARSRCSSGHRHLQ
jgi:YD repeat-containing protein